KADHESSRMRRSEGVDGVWMHCKQDRIRHVLLRHDVSRSASDVEVVSGEDPLRLGKDALGLLQIHETALIRVGNGVEGTALHLLSNHCHECVGSLLDLLCLHQVHCRRHRVRRTRSPGYSQ
ncbi:hypothetical protein PENTCL1PPCAC_20738, partial [Pristionchus entomophagus]